MLLGFLNDLIVEYKQGQESRFSIADAKMDSKHVVSTQNATLLNE